MNLQDWVGRSETLIDDIVAYPVAALAATLDAPMPRPARGTPLPPLWHWLYFLVTAPQSDIGPDGHPKRGGFLPPIELPRRMWAGSQLDFLAPIRVGERVARVSTIENVTEKSGRSGQLVFVKVRHEYRAEGASEVALREFHDIVYRAAPSPHDPTPSPTLAPEDAQWSRRIKADEVMLFRYSALTFNGHRIHYDRPYVTEVEGYPGLIVHGPLLATLLLEQIRRELPDARVKSFRFRAIRPTFDINPFSVHGKLEEGGRVRIWARDHEGWLTMDGEAVIE
jgi:3-methylfumaryl-CoA hydratase